MQDDRTDPLFMEALEWLAVVNDDKAGEEQRRAFSGWLAADPKHMAAYERARLLWDRFEIVKPEYLRLKGEGRIGRRGVLIGGVALLACLPAAWLLRDFAFAPDFSTSLGERRAFRLEDGSHVELGSHSSLSLAFSPGERRLILHRGQGFFTVAPDAGRPFVVEAGRGETRALGTAFDIKSHGGETVVTVTESAVSVAFPGADAVTLHPGWQARYSDARLAPPHEVDLDAVTAWRSDRIIFENAPLRSVLRELERYRRGRIMLVDDGIGDIPVTAVFETAQAGGALSVIASTLPIRVVEAGGLIAFVYRR